MRGKSSFMIEISDIRSHDEVVAAFFSAGANPAQDIAASDNLRERLREIDMTWGVLGAIDQMWAPNEASDWIAAEMPTASSIADLAVARFDRGATASRQVSAPHAITLPLRIRTLDAVANRRITRIDTLALRMGSNPQALMRSTLKPLMRDGWIDYSEGRVAMNRPWVPLCEELMTVEMKLNDWRGAIEQARSQAMSANRVWVVLPEKSDRTINNALPDFKSRGIGLAMLRNDDSLRILTCGRKQKPVRWLNALLAEMMYEHFSKRLGANRDSNCGDPVVQKSSGTICS